jgi:anaerobic dimethyl sulfoxide reductase subunit A
VASPLLADLLARGKAGGYPADIKMIYSAAGDLFNQLPNVNKTVAAARGLEFMVAHDHFVTPTARYADILLPATTFWERNDVHTPWAGAGHYVIFMRQAIEPVGECRNDLDICGELARRLGLEGYNDRTEEAWLRELTGDVIDDFGTFRARGLARLPAPEDAVAFAREIRDPERHPFSTPSGKIEIYSMPLAARPDPYGLGPIPPIPTWIPDEPDGRHPLRLVTPKSRARTHSIHDNQPVLARADRDDVWIHPADAAARGIADGEPVRVYNDRGRTVLPARVTDRIAPGVVSIKEGAWFALDGDGQDTRGCANVLTEDRASPAGAASFNTCFVEIERVR